MKVALYQMKIVWEDKETNYFKVDEKLKKIHGKQVDLFLLPEMSFTGFSMNTDLTKENDDKTINYMMGYARKYHTALGFGWVKDCGEKAENHYTVVDRNGIIVSDYIKIHPFSYSGENKRFQGGSNIALFQLNDFKISTFICYDLRFPEIFQIASKNVDVILVPANWPSSRSEHWKCLLRARAIENQVYIIAVNCVGEINGINYSGDSCIINPNGEFLLESTLKEDVLEFELENNVQKYREEFPIKRDRREALYKIL